MWIFFGVRRTLESPFCAKIPSWTRRQCKKRASVNYRAAGGAFDVAIHGSHEGISTSAWYRSDYPLCRPWSRTTPTSSMPSAVLSAARNSMAAARLLPIDLQRTATPGDLRIPTPIETVIGKQGREARIGRRNIQAH